jgi:cytochrome P450
MDVERPVRLAELNVDPYPTYKRLRDEETISWADAANRYLVTRWDDVVHVDTHHDLFVTGETDSLMTKAMGLTMLRADGAAHERLRKAAEEPLRPKVVRRRWVEMLNAVANDLVDRFAERGECELVSEFCSPYASRTLKNILGLQGASDEDMQKWSQAFIDGIGNYADDPDVWARCDEANLEVEESIEENLPRVKNEQDGSVLSAMARAMEGGDLALEEIQSNIKLFISGGLNEPRDAVAHAVWGLLTHLDQAAMVREDPGLFAAAAEESLRWISPIGMYPRQVARDTELAGVKLEEGDRLGVVIASANRDERHWDDPDSFDIRRGKVKHLAFGMGPHYCLGTWVARQQLGATALPTLFQRLPDMHLNLDHPPEFRGWVFRGPAHLRLKWDAHGG